MNLINMAYHSPVLLKESVEGLNLKPEGVYIDLTFGGGGHARRVLEALKKKGRLLAFDQDPDAAQNVSDDKRLVFINANFRYLRNFLRYYEIEAVDGILADLGISSYQIDEPSKGFTFRDEAPLDMRMNPSSSITASMVINDYAEKELVRVFSDFGELKNARRIAKSIAEARKKNPINESIFFKEVLSHLAPSGRESKFYARVYQAIRIEVNEEIDALKEMLLQTTDSLKTGGRLVMITYHSIEDRLVKNFMKTGNLEGKVEKDFYGNLITPWKLISRRAIKAGDEEILVNSRSRSASLRIAEKI